MFGFSKLTKRFNDPSYHESGLAKVAHHWEWFDSPKQWKNEMKNIAKQRNKAYRIRNQTPLFPRAKNWADPQLWRLMNKYGNDKW